MPFNPMTGPEPEGLIKTVQATKPDVLKLAQSAIVFKRKKNNNLKNMFYFGDPPEGFQKLFS
jgi:hypothetical protein